MRPPHLAHSTASSHALNRAVWPGGLASDGSAEPPLPPSAYCDASRALTSGERIAEAPAAPSSGTFLPNQRKRSRTIDFAMRMSAPFVIPLGSKHARPTAFIAAGRLV